MSMNDAPHKMFDMSPTGKTASSTGAGAALGYLFVVFFPMATGVELTAEQASGITGAVGSLAGFIWHQIERRRGHG